MKKRTASVLCALLLCALCGCSFNPCVPRGYVSAQEHWEQDAFQDSTDYCVYHYDTSKAIASNHRYKLMTEADVADIRDYFEHFAGAMEVGDRLDEYDFDEACISAGDYCFVKTKEGEKIRSYAYDEDGETVSVYAYDRYDDYTVCFFDTDTLTLYYIHTNI